MQIDFAGIEEKWKKSWEKDGVYHVSHDSDKPKFYVLDMFPYPSGSGLHVGHPLGYIASDIVISANQLTRLFHKELDMTVIAYIRQERMKLAKRLIQETDLPIKRIAQECGCKSRPRGSQIGAWVSAQSSVITSRSLLENKFQEMKQKFSRKEIPLPSFWGGYRVVPEEIEFWQGRRNRLHDRFQYSKQDDGSWAVERLAP